MSRACSRCKKKMGLLEVKSIHGDDSICNECYEIIKKEQQSSMGGIEENIENKDEEQKDVLYRLAGAYSHIADAFKRK
jgi:hypothetical protein